MRSKILIEVEERERGKKHTPHLSFVQQIEGTVFCKFTSIKFLGLLMLAPGVYQRLFIDLTIFFGARS
ncbi:hypothetical protein Cha6605_3213 [Chamaesiphon minutus PCC 6605]|uniref:Uncharacterized protein n=1 Tax=Chamaesiphon minutus (strain ATCC 27169 / PCC 6605) TaxID=1173020 RepID=K9UHU4_CHAP6|nr:hypothetical protein Cha6605_3213 [Chamaesiphon minutus PCC 6605]